MASSNASAQSSSPSATHERRRSEIRCSPTWSTAALTAASWVRTCGHVRVLLQHPLDAAQLTLGAAQAQDELFAGRAWARWSPRPPLLPAAAGAAAAAPAAEADDRWARRRRGSGARSGTR